MELSQIHRNYMENVIDRGVFWLRFCEQSKRPKARWIKVLMPILKQKMAAIEIIYLVLSK